MERSNIDTRPNFFFHLLSKRFVADWVRSMSTHINSCLCRTKSADIKAEGVMHLHSRQNKDRNVRSVSGMLAGRTHHFMTLQEGFAATNLKDDKTATGS
jgi:hypothetical protein